jgi:hypothetical protein
MSGVTAGDFSKVHDASSGFVEAPCDACQAVPGQGVCSARAEEHALFGMVDKLALPR